MAPTATNPVDSDAGARDLASAAVRATTCLFTGNHEERVERALAALGTATECSAAYIYEHISNGTDQRVLCRWSRAEGAVQAFSDFSDGERETLEDGGVVRIDEHARTSFDVFVVAPVVREGAVVMALGVGFDAESSCDLDVFAPVLAAFARAVGEVIALPIELSHAQQRIRIDEALVEISHMLVASREIDFEALLRLVGSATGVEAAYFVQLPLDAETLTGRDGRGDRMTIYRWSRGGEFVAEHVEDIDVQTSDLALSGMIGMGSIGGDGGAHEVVRAGAVPVLSLGDRLFGYLGFESDGSPGRLRDEDTRVLGILGDILATFFERKLAERALQESEERWRRLVEHHPEPILLTTGGIIHYVNSAAVRVLGAAEREEIVGTSLRDFVSAEYFESIDSRSARLEAGELPEPYEHEMIRFDGEERIVESASVPIMYEGKRFALTVMRDVTAQRLAEEGYRTFVETITEAICRIDLDRPVGRDVLPVLQRKHILEHGYVAECNGIMAELLSRSREEIEGQSFSSVLPQIRASILDEFIENGYHLRNREMTAHRSGRSPRHFVVNAVGTLERGKLTRIWGSCIEVTQRVELERRIVGALEEQQQEIGRDLHDGVGQLLTGVRMMTQNLVERFREEDHPALDVATKVARFAEEATRHVRDIYRGLTPAQLYHEGLSATLAELAHTLDTLPDIRCEFVHSGGAEIEDRDVKLHLFRIAQEAVNNALKHARAKNIAIFFGREGEQLVLRVQDDGVGLHHPSDQKGTSIGLDSMRYRAVAIGGSLGVSDGASGGTVIECRMQVRR